MEEMKDISGSWFSSVIFSFIIFWLVYMTSNYVSYELFYEANMVYFLIAMGIAFLISVVAMLLSPNSELQEASFIFAIASVFAAIFGSLIISETSEWVYNTFAKYADTPWIMALISSLYQYVVALVVLFILLIIAAIIYKFGASE